MIPHKLQIKNFLSYGSEIQTISFEQYPLICLSGKNGHGKSALLDAITWAIWGQARKLAGAVKADHGLLRLGQTQMMVSLDFEANGQMYRVRREFAQTYGKPYAALDFGILDPVTDTIVSLTDKTIKDTQTKIEDTLHLDFDAFINSAFLRQGQSNEFSKKSAKERKDVLASILGLNRYETVRKRAAQKVKDAQLQKVTLAAIQEKIETELQTQTIIEESRTQLQGTLLTLQNKEQQLRQELAAQEKTRAHYLQYEHERTLLVQEQAHLMLDQEQKRTTLRAKIQEWKTVHKQLLCTNNQHRHEQEKQQLLTQLATQQTQAQKQLMLKEELLKQKEKLQNIKNEINTKHAQEIGAKKLVLQKIHMEATYAANQKIEYNKQQENNEKELTTYYAQLEQLTTQYHPDDSLIDQRVQQEKQFEKRREHYQQWIAQANMLRGEDSSIHQKVMLVDEDTQSCPLCEQNVSAARRRFLKKKFESTQQSFKNRLTRLSNLIKKLKPILIDQHTSIEHIKKQIQEKQINDHKIDAIHKVIQKLQMQQKMLQEAHAALVQKRNELLAQDQQLSTEIELFEQSLPLIIEQDGGYQQAITIHTQIVQQLKQLAYDAALHEQLAIRINELQELLTTQQDLEKQRTLQPSRTETIFELCTQLKLIKQKYTQIEVRIANSDKLTAGREEVIARCTNINEQINSLLQEKEQIFVAQGSIENQLKKLEQLKKEKKELAQTLGQLDGIIDDYQAIATATGKDGIQALTN